MQARTNYCSTTRQMIGRTRHGKLARSRALRVLPRNDPFGAGVARVRCGAAARVRQKYKRGIGHAELDEPAQGYPHQRRAAKAANCGGTVDVDRACREIGIRRGARSAVLRTPSGVPDWPNHDPIPGTISVRSARLLRPGPIVWRDSGADLAGTCPGPRCHRGSAGTAANVDVGRRFGRIDCAALSKLQKVNTDARNCIRALISGRTARCARIRHRGNSDATRVRLEAVEIPRTRAARNRART